jgi:hypothetical protein
MLESPPTVVPVKPVPVGTIACPRNCRPGGFTASLALRWDTAGCGDRHCDRGDD